MGSSAGKTNRRRTPGNLGHDSLPLAGGAERYETMQFAARRFAGGAERYEPRETPCTPSNPDAPRGGRTPSLVRAAPMQFFSKKTISTPSAILPVSGTRLKAEKQPASARLCPPENSQLQGSEL